MPSQKQYFNPKTMIEEQNTCPLEIAKKLKSLGILLGNIDFYWTKDVLKKNQIDLLYYKELFNGTDKQNNEIFELEDVYQAPQLHDLPDILRQLVATKPRIVVDIFDLSNMWIDTQWRQICNLWLKSPKAAWEYLDNLLD